MRLRRVESIDIYRIICCISVYSMHFFGMAVDESKPYVDWFRTSVWFKSVFCFFFSELTLMAFFVTGGFFIPAAFADKDDKDSLIVKMFERCLNILIPGLAVILITAAVTGLLKPFGLSDMFSFKELFRDIFKLIIGIPGDRHIHFGYPLWFQHFMFIGYIAGFVFLMVFGKYDKLKYAAYLAVLVYTLFNSPFVFLVLCGTFAGELCYGKYSEMIHKKFGNAYVCFAIMLIAIILMPVVFSFDYSSPGICGPEGVLFIILIVSMYNLEVYVRNKNERQDKKKNRFTAFLSRNTYSCYLVHFLVYSSVLRVMHRVSLGFDLLWKNKMVGCMVLYILITPVLWIVSEIFTRCVMTPLKKLTVSLTGKIKGAV